MFKVYSYILILFILVVSSRRKRRTVASSCLLAPSLCDAIPATTALGISVTKCPETSIMSVSPLEGSTDDPITIIGMGFTHEDCVLVHVGDKECDIQTMETDDAGVSNITCLINATMLGTSGARSSAPLAVGPVHDIQVLSPDGKAALYQTFLTDTFTCYRCLFMVGTERTARFICVSPGRIPCRRCEFQNFSRHSTHSCHHSHSWVRHRKCHGDHQWKRLCGRGYFSQHGQYHYL